MIKFHTIKNYFLGNTRSFHVDEIKEMSITWILLFMLSLKCSKGWYDLIVRGSTILIISYLKSVIFIISVLVLTFLFQETSTSKDISRRH